MRVKGSTRIKMSLLPGSEKVQVIVSEEETSPIQIFHQRSSNMLSKSSSQAQYFSYI